MTENRTFGVISCFVAETLKNIAIQFLTECWKCAGNTNEDVVEWDDESGVPIIPLVLCERRNELKRNGVLFPDELIIERSDFLPTVDAKGRLSSSPIDVMIMRLRVLKELYGCKCREDFLGYMSNWMAGIFRKYLMLNPTTHGTSEFIDLEKVKKGRDPILMALAGFDDRTIKERCYQKTEDEEKDINKKIEQANYNKEILSRRFEDGAISQVDSLLKFRDLVKSIFSIYYVKIHNILSSRDMDENERFRELCNIYCDEEQRLEKDESRDGQTIVLNDGACFHFQPRNHIERLPVAFGDRAKYVTPSGKLNLLLIDDHVKESPFSKLSKNMHVEEAGFSSCISQDDWDLLRDIFNVKALEVDREKDDFYNIAVQNFRDFQEKGLTYDLILVDLCLGNNRQEEDLDGYAMIRIVKAFFPGTPIVVYSRFSDMGHIARAFASGAKWFLVKGEEAKLPRHVLKLLRQPGWYREWNAIVNSSQATEFLFSGKEDDFARRFNRKKEWQYLTYKCLESFPGKFITVKRMGGGISSSVTFKATKGVKLGEEFLQSPSIIKIDASYNTMMEYERYNRMIRPYIANEAGRIEMPERVLSREYSSIVYTFAGKQDKAHVLESMGDLLDDNVVSQSACDYETYRYALNCIFDEILPKIHSVSPEFEFADIGKSIVQLADAQDAFAWEAAYGGTLEKWKTSFPNFYFNEFIPTKFWKSYVHRMQPWGCFPIDDVMTDSDGMKRLFLTQPTDDGAQNVSKRKQVIFHNVMTDPYATRKSGKGGRQLIEAYTSDQKLVWLSGDVSDFAARFRRRVLPGMSLWLENAEWLDDENKFQRVAWEDDKGKKRNPEKRDQQGKTIKNDSDDWRLEWLRKTFECSDMESEKTGDSERQGKQGATQGTPTENGMPQTQEKFVTTIGCFMDIPDFDDIENDDLLFYINLQNAILDIAEKTPENAEEWGMKCPVGIVHGDLNAKNVMLESRKHPPKEDDLDITKTVSDVWLIDFARTRRDLIAHDFNVFFTSVLGELFTEELIGKEGGKMSKRQEEYWEKLVANFKVIVSSAVKPESRSEKGVPDEIKDDQRFTLIYRILRRAHDAAIKAGVSQNMYLLTTALTCFYTIKIFLNNGCKVRLAAGFFTAAWICYDLLCNAIDEKNVMEEYKGKGGEP